MCSLAIRLCISTPFSTTSFRAFFRDQLLSPAAQVPTARIDHYYDLFNTPAARGSALATLRATVDVRNVEAHTTRIQTPTLVISHNKTLAAQLYGEFRDFNPAWLRLIEPLRALRYIHYSTWIARRWNDPTFKRTFDHFGTLQYWQKEIQDLRELLARIMEVIWH